MREKSTARLPTTHRIDTGQACQLFLCLTGRDYQQFSKGTPNKKGRGKTLALA